MNDSVEKTSVNSGIYPKGTMTIDQIIKKIKSHPNAKEIGSIHTFSGIVRNTSIKGKSVKSMKIDAYEELANHSIKKICEDIKKIEGIVDIILVHFRGDFDLSEDLVHVVVASSHREEGFKALRTAVENYKSQIAVWKREDYDDGSSEWIH